MKKTIYIFVCVLCVAVVVIGKIYWNHRIASTATQAEQHTQSATNQNDSPNASDTTKKTSVDVDKLTSDLPKSLAKKVSRAAKDGKTLKMLVVTPDKKPGWLPLLQDQLDDAYGKDLFDLTSESYGEKTTSDFLQASSYKSLFDLPRDTDIVLFESLILNDQGHVRTDDSLEGTLALKKAVEDKDKSMVFAMMPPNPLYKEPYYTGHVDQLADYAQKHDILYIDHWDAWPKPSSDKLRADLQKDKTTPNKKGDKIWAGALADYFTSK